MTRHEAANTIIADQGRVAATLLAALLEIRDGLADTGTLPREYTTKLTKREAWRLADVAIKLATGDHTETARHQIANETNTSESAAS